MTGTYTGSDGRVHLAYGTVRTAEFPLPDSWGPDHQIGVFIDFNDTDNTDDDQRFLLLLHTGDKTRMSGLTWWNKTAYGTALRRYCGQSLQFHRNTDPIRPDHFIGLYNMDHNGQRGTLALESIGLTMGGMTDLSGYYIRVDGVKVQAKAKVLDPDFQNPLPIVASHQISLSIDLGGTPGNTDDDLHAAVFLFTQSKDRIAGMYSGDDNVIYGIQLEKTVKPEIESSTTDQ